MRCTQGIRTFEYQKALYAQGRTAPGPIVTNSLPGWSWHHYGCALDTCFQGQVPYPEDEAMWKEFGAHATGHGFIWGGHFPGLVDRPHIQLTYGLTIKEVRALYEFGGQVAVWTAFDKARGVPQGQDWYGPQPRSKLLELGQLV